MTSTSILAGIVLFCFLDTSFEKEKYLDYENENILSQLHPAETFFLLDFQIPKQLSHIFSREIENLTQFQSYNTSRFFCAFSYEASVLRKIERIIPVSISSSREKKYEISKIEPTNNEKRIIL